MLLSGIVVLPHNLRRLFPYCLDPSVVTGDGGGIVLSLCTALLKDKGIDACEDGRFVL